MRNIVVLPSLILVALTSTVVRTQAQYTAYDLGFGQALAINSYGTVVGFSGSIESHHAFSYSGGAMTDLGTLGGANSGASAINNAGAGTNETNELSWRIRRAALRSGRRVGSGVTRHGKCPSSVARAGATR